MPNAEEAEQFKAAGNAALQAGNLTEAIESYTKAINADGTNHVYYSNRSAAYLKKGDGNNALEDANSTVAINPEFSKGYSRKGGESYSRLYFANAHTSCVHIFLAMLKLKSYDLFISICATFSRTACIETLQ